MGSMGSATRRDRGGRRVFETHASCLYIMAGLYIDMDSGQWAVDSGLIQAASGKLLRGDLLRARARRVRFALSAAIFRALYKFVLCECEWA